MTRPNRATSVLPPDNPDKEPVFLIYRFTMKGGYAPSLIYGIQVDGAGKSRLGSVVSTDPAPGDMVHRQLLNEEDAKLSLWALSINHPVQIGKDTK